jgi:predicted TIM-barrel fold metal-dependent hydrolase
VLLDDTQYTIPVIERALELGVNVIAVHKAIPFGPTASVNYRTDDVDIAAALYPEMNFEIVHAGYAFLEDTLILAARFPNVWANLEVTASMAVNNPRRFADVIGGLLYWGAAERTLFASGCTMVHPQPAIEALMRFQVPQDMIEGFGYPQITDEVKRKILGANFLRLHGVDEDALRARIAGDKWSKARESGHLEPPWHNLRQGASESPRIPAQTA